MMKQRFFTVWLAWSAGCLSLPAGVFAADVAGGQEMIVYRTPACGCCAKWLEYVKQNGFVVKSVVTDDIDAIKKRLGVPEQLASCHTAVVGGYVVEGHVPVEDMRKLLSSGAKLAGIAAPGMPLGSPGMEVNGQKQRYSVVGFDAGQPSTTFAVHE